MDRKRKALSLFNIAPGEERLVLLLLLLFFSIGLVRVLSNTAAYALFMAEFGAQALPYTYVGVSIVVTLVSLGYLKLSERLPFMGLLTSSLGFLLLYLGGTRIGLGMDDNHWVIAGLPVGFEMVWALSQLVIWNLAGRLLDVRQGKRLFGLIASGEQVAIVAGGFAAPWLVVLMGTANLFWVAAVALFGALCLLLLIGRLFPWQVAGVTTSVEAPRPEEEVRAERFFKNPYVLLIFTCFALWVLSWFFIDTIFYMEVETRYPSEELLGAFLGPFFAVVGLLTLLNASVLSSRIFGHYGLRGGLLTTPITVAVATGAIVLFGSVGAIALLIFYAATLARLLIGILSDSIFTPALNILYQPLPAAARVRTQAATEGILYPLAVGASGLLLLLLTNVLAFRALGLAYVALGLLSSWIVISVLLGKRYPLVLVRALRKRRLEGAELSWTDASSQAVLRAELQSPYPGTVIYALQVLEGLGDESLPATLKALLEHTDATVRRDVLVRIERRGLGATLPAVRQRVTREELPIVRGAAIRTLVALGESAVVEEVLHYLADPEDDVKAGALVGLLRSGGVEGVLAAGQVLLTMAGSTEPLDRALAARVLGEVGVRNFHQPLLSLLHDDDLEVRRTAIRAAGHLQNPALWPGIVEGLAHRALRPTSITALATIGESIVPVLKEAYEEGPQEPAILIALIQIGGRIRGDAVVAFLRERLDVSDEMVRTQVLRALRRCDYQAQGEEAQRVLRQIENEVSQVVELLAAIVTLGDGEETELLRAALTSSVAHAQKRLFYLLSFLYDSRSILQAEESLRHPEKDKRAYALEIIDVLVAKQLKPLLFPLLTELRVEERLQQLAIFFPQPSLSEEQCLERLISGSRQQAVPWVRVCALYAVGRLQIAAVQEAVREALTAPERQVRETARWTLARIEQGGPSQRTDADDSLARQETTRLLQSGSGRGGGGVLLTVEKVLILKGVSLFANVEDAILSDIATLVELVEYKANETIFEKGDMGTSLYVIVEGEVRVHIEGQTLNLLKEREIFGEMALLDPEPRMASVTATADTWLLRLDQEPFYELMDEHGEIARGIIRVLSRYLRARVRDLQEARTRLEVLEHPTAIDGSMRPEFQQARAAATI